MQHIQGKGSYRTGASARNVWMFDVDGVLVSLLSKCANEVLLDILAQRMSDGDIVTFNSGRSVDAIAELVLSLLERRIADKDLLLHMMVVGEMGGSWASYAPDGTLEIAFETQLTVPTMLRSAMGELVVDPDFSEIIEIEGGKRTMISVIKRRGIELVTFQQVQAKFVPLAQQCLADLGLAMDWKIDAVSDSVEIEHAGADKGKGACRILRWLQDQGIQARHVIAIEDSPSGISMAEVIHRAHVPIEFVFTGTMPLPHSMYAFPVVHTEHKYEQGTIEYLARYQEPLAAMRGANQYGTR